MVHVNKSRPFHDESIVPFKINTDEKEQLSALKVEDGFLVGFYRGEWGGHLDWYSKNGDNHYKISDDEIVQFIKRGDKIYAIQGLDHMSISAGSIFTIEKTDGRWTAGQYLKLPSEPRSIALDLSNNFFVITNKSLLKIDTGRKIITLVKNGFWHSTFYSNAISAAIKDSVVYVGMRAGVYKYNLLTGKQEWLLPE